MQVSDDPRVGTELAGYRTLLGLGGMGVVYLVPFIRAKVPAIDLIDFDFACWHLSCDDLSQVSERSLDATGEAVLELILSS